MHIMIFNVVTIRLLVIMSAESRKAFIAKVSFDWVYTSDQYIKTAIKLFLVQKKWVIDITLN